MKIVIADPQGRVCHSLRILLEQQPGIIVTGIAAEYRELIAVIGDTSPDLILVDWDLPGLPAENILRLLRGRFPGMLILSMSGRQELGQIAVKSGADGFACKTESPLKLLSLIQNISSGIK